MDDARRRAVLGYLTRSLAIAAGTTIVVAAGGAIAALAAIVGAGISADRDTGVYGVDAPISVGGPSEAEIWYGALASLSGWLPLALGVMLLLVQPVMELVRAGTRSRGLASLAGVGVVALAGVWFGVYLVFGAPVLTWIGGGRSVPRVSEIGDAIFVLVFGLVAYGTPVLLVTAVALGLTLLVDRRRVRAVAVGVAAVVLVGAIVASTGAFRPPPAQDVAAAQSAEAVDRFTRALDGIDGVADVEVVGAGATVTMALDAGVGHVLAAADAAKRAGDGSPGIALVVIQREPDPDSPAQQQDPPRGPWRVQLVPSDRSADEIADELQRLMLTERLQVGIVLTEDGFPSITVSSMAALPAAVRELREVYPDGAYYRVEDRFRMTDDPTQLSSPMVETILDIVAAVPTVEIEVNSQPKLYVNDVSPEQAAVIVDLLADPALVGTSPSGYPADYQIRTTGPDGDVFLEGTFG